MFALVLLCVVLIGAPGGADGCPGIDAAGLDLAQRRAALDGCARTSNKPSIDFFLDRVATLALRDGRIGIYGDMASTWSTEELVGAAPRLLLMARGDGGLNDGVRIVAIRALLAIPKDRRPPEAAPFEPLTVEISTTPSRMTYDKKEFTASPGQVVKVVFHNPDALEHNLLLVTPGAMAEIGLAGDRMGQTPDGKVKEFVPDSPKVLAVMGLVAPGASRDFWFLAPMKPATYPYVCTYPQHWRMMNGKMKVVAPPAASERAPSAP